MRLTIFLVGAAAGLLQAACAARSAPQVDPAATWNGDSIVAPVLRAPVLSRTELEASDSLASIHDDFDARLAAVVADTSAPPLVRSNALLLLSDRGVLDVDTYLDAARARDDRVRAAGLVAIKPFLPRWSNSVVVVRRALNDSSALVQAKALELLTAEDIDDLRAYQRRTRHPDLRNIADDLIRTAEERGAPLVPDSTGALTRTSLAGPTLSFRPTRRWENWGVALGTLTVSLPGQPAVRLSDSVEVVNNVLPAFVSADGTYLLYEAARQVRVRNLGTGTDRVAAYGIAPRLMPFSESFLYLREQPPGKVRKENTVVYDVLMAPLAGGDSTVLGSLSMPVAHERFGRASPARWMLVRETQGRFQLAGEGFEPFALPDPFASAPK